MDKSEGKDFFSKTFSSLGKKMATVYQKGKIRSKLSSLKRTKNEKLFSLGIKVYEMMKSNEKVENQLLIKDYQSIEALDKQINETEEEIKILSTVNDKKNVKEESASQNESENKENPVDEKTKKAPAKKRSTTTKSKDTKNSLKDSTSYIVADKPKRTTKQTTPSKEKTELVEKANIEEEKKTQNTEKETDPENKHENDISNQ